jgi:hypothetical protein
MGSYAMTLMAHMSAAASAVTVTPPSCSACSASGGEYARLNVSRVVWPACMQGVRNGERQQRHEPAPLPCPQGCYAGCESAAAGRTNFGRAAEVNECPGVLPRAPENVAWLEVPVHNPKVMQRFDPVADVTQHLHAPVATRTALCTRGGNTAGRRVPKLLGRGPLWPQ